MKIALVAHDNKKNEIISLSKRYSNILKKSDLYSTRQTGEKIENNINLKVNKLKSGPTGGILKLLILLLIKI